MKLCVRYLSVLFVVCFVALPGSLAGEFATETITGTNMVRQTSNTGSNYFMGNVGIGHDNPTEELDVEGVAKVSDGMVVGDAAIGNDLLRLYFEPVNKNASDGIFLEYNPSSTGLQDDDYRGIYVDVRSEIPANSTNAGFVAGQLIQNIGRSNMLGELGELYGQWVKFGHFDGSSGHTENVIGIQIHPYRKAGSMGVMYGLKIQTPVGSGATIDSQFPIYSGWDSPSYLSGDLGIGIEEPEVELHVAGQGKFDDGVIYIAPVGDIQMGTYTNGL